MRACLHMHCCRSSVDCMYIQAMKQQVFLKMVLSITLSYACGQDRLGRTSGRLAGWLTDRPPPKAVGMLLSLLICLC